MKVILLERLEGWGGLGDVVTVKDGFARNFLLPRSKALRANAANLKVFEAQRAENDHRRRFHDRFRLRPRVAAVVDALRVG